MMKLLSEIIFPPLCLHCETKMLNNTLLFCSGCSGFFELINPLSRCNYCFKESEGRRRCEECVIKHPGPFKMAAALDYLGAVSSLVKKLKYGHLPYLAKTAAAFMLTQFMRLNWPMPDVIIPVPSRQRLCATNHALLLAQHFAKMIKIPCRDVLKRKGGDFSQARLNKVQREKLGSTHFLLKKHICIEDEIVLLIDDVITTGATVRNCAEVLYTGFPAKVYALSLARTP